MISLFSNFQKRGRELQAIEHNHQQKTKAPPHNLNNKCMLRNKTSPIPWGYNVHGNFIRDSQQQCGLTCEIRLYPSQSKKMGNQCCFSNNTIQCHGHERILEHSVNRVASEKLPRLCISWTPNKFPQTLLPTNLSYRLALMIGPYQRANQSMPTSFSLD